MHSYVQVSPLIIYSIILSLHLDSTALYIFLLTVLMKFLPTFFLFPLLLWIHARHLSIFLYFIALVCEYYITCDFATCRRQRKIYFITSLLEQSVLYCIITKRLVNNQVKLAKFCGCIHNSPPITR